MAGGGGGLGVLEGNFDGYGGWIIAIFGRAIFLVSVGTNVYVET